jgi:protein-S-isoprenylcysteine O-methyltransferase Ste14
VRLDIRLPIGALLALTGAILVVFGLSSDPAIYTRSLGLNINAWWGAVLIVIGGVMLMLAARARRRAAGGA